jgi:hypothetical protein
LVLVRSRPARRRAANVSRSTTHCSALSTSLTSWHSLLFLTHFCFNSGRNSRETHHTLAIGASPLGRLGLACSRSRHKKHAKKNVRCCGLHVLTTIKIFSFSFSPLYSLRSGRIWNESLGIATSNWRLPSRSGTAHSACKRSFHPLFSRASV